MNQRHPSLLPHPKSRPAAALRSLLVGLVSLGAFACSGGSSGARVASPSCESDSNFCLVSCNLGCTVTGGCAISEIAQNQPIELHFSDSIDPASVTAGAVSLRTPAGEPPAGSFVVSGSSLVFVPEVRIAGGVTRFGFRTGETYILNLRASATGESLRSVSGDRLARTVICALTVTQGLVDLDGQRPTAELLVPTQLEGVPKDTQIVVRFSELIDISAFAGGSTLTSPIIYQIRETLPDPADPTQRICNDEVGYVPTLIEGVPVPNVLATSPPRTEVVLQPAVDLPSGACIDVLVTEQVRDLAGKPAVPQRFRFRIDAGNPQPIPITETFENDSFLDRQISGGTWRNGTATPARFGGSGALGSFDYTLGVNSPPQSATFVFDTDSQLFPGTATLFGTPITVTDGLFEFTDFVVPSGIRVVFRGSNPAVIRVRGRVQIDGEVSVDGAAPSSAIDTRGAAGPPGQPGTPHPGEAAIGGGAGGGSGGKGGEGCIGTGASAINRGDPGEDCEAPASSGYAGQLGGTGGRGGDVWPTSGLRINVTYNLFFSITGMASGGGGGGSFLGAGTPGRITRTFTAIPTDIGPGAAAGASVAFRGLPTGTSTLDHFLVGGSGGGGGGTHPVNLSQNEVNGSASFGPRPWHAGGAGGGGGGAIAFRVGYGVEVSPAGAIASRGGGGARHLNANTGPPAPGGGGSGGSIVIQLEDASRFVQGGSLDVSGGLGTFVTNTQFNNDRLEGAGGNGGHGYVRLEANGVSAQTLGTVVGPAAVTADNFGPPAADDGDLQTGFASTWRSTRQIFPPRYLHYRMICRIAGQQLEFTDDPASPNPANRNDLPLRIYFQGGRVNAGSNQLEGNPGPWRDFVSESAPGASIADDSATGFRFMILFNRDIETDVVVEEVTVTIEA
jgi:hypothetical protein